MIEQDNIDPDTWILYQVRKRSVDDYERLVKHIEKLPNPISDLDARIEAGMAELKLLRESRDALAAKCLHIAWRDGGGFEFYVETCVQCGHTEYI